MNGSIRNVCWSWLIAAATVASGQESDLHWSFRTPVRPEVPLADRGGNPIDGFITERLVERGIVPLGAVDRRTLIRRVTLDLTGLPPTPAEVEAFLVDAAPDAYQRLLDRLLASPHYGERWARHWLDIARYADSNGLDENIAHGNAWRYRDYVIRSLNEDKPYDQFLTEQLAGDLLDSGDDPALRRDRLIATGLLSLGPKVLAEVDEKKMEMDIVDEQVDTVSRALMGLTLGCARCHDHKFDPIGQKDYYALAGIFQSTRTMDSFTKIARWHEHSIATGDELARKDQHDKLLAARQQQLEARIAAARSKLPPPSGETQPADIEARFPPETRTELEQIRREIATLEAAAPVMPTAMGVADGVVADTPLLQRGDHLAAGEVIPRGFPRVLAGDARPTLPPGTSGRRELARWLTSRSHPLTARVLVNRLWRWHFGKGLVPTVDNFGKLGVPPTHPELLDWLAVTFVEQGWSLKTMHRRIMTSDAYRRSSAYNESAAAVDPENRTYWRFDLHRLEAEVIRDAILAVSGTLDQTLGGSLLEVKNREFLFDHTSRDHSRYSHIRRRSIYLPVIRNHLYDWFQIFDYTNASILNGDRATSTLAPQALLLMNSEMIADVAGELSERLLRTASTPEERTSLLFELAYARPPQPAERARILRFVNSFIADAGGASGNDTQRQAWQAVCQAVFASSEFIYLR